MKRIICIVAGLVLVLSLAACGNKEPQKTEDQIREEVGAEMESENRENVITLSGRLVSEGPPFGTGIELEEAIEAKGKSVEILYFLTDVEKYLDRKHFIWNEDFGTMLDSNSDVKIKIEVNKDEIMYVDFPYVEDCKLLEINGDSELMDKTDGEYTFEYYKGLFYAFCYEKNDGFVPKDVKETYYYKNTDGEIGDQYKKAVDFMLDQGIKISMQEGMYYIYEK